MSDSNTELAAKAQAAEEKAREAAASAGDSGDYEEAYAEDENEEEK